MRMDVYYNIILLCTYAAQANFLLGSYDFFVLRRRHRRQTNYNIIICYYNTYTIVSSARKKEKKTERGVEKKLFNIC